MFSASNSELSVPVTWNQAGETVFLVRTLYYHSALLWDCYFSPNVLELPWLSIVGISLCYSRCLQIEGRERYHESLKKLTSSTAIIARPCKTNLSLRSKRFCGAKSEGNGVFGVLPARKMGREQKQEGGGGGGEGRKRLPPSIVIFKTAHLAFHAWLISRCHHKHSSCVCNPCARKIRNLGSPYFPSNKNHTRLP